MFNSLYGLGFCLHHEQSHMNDLMSKCAEILDLKTEISLIVVKIALSESFEPFTKFNVHFNQTIETMKRFDSFNFDCLGKYDDFEMMNQASMYDYAWLEHFETLLRLKSIKDLDEFLKDQFEDDRDVRNTDRKLLLKCSTILLDYADFLNVNIDDIIATDILDRLSS